MKAVPHKSDEQPDRCGPRERRLHALKDLVADKGYDVPAADVAASIIRDAIVVAAPPRRR